MLDETKRDNVVRSAPLIYSVFKLTHISKSETRTNRVCSGHAQKKLYKQNETLTIKIRHKKMQDTK